MADITFWKDEYQKFIDGVLREEQRQFLEKADLVGQEIAYLEENGANLLSDNPKHFVLFLHINNLINTLDPKGCYPGFMMSIAIVLWKFWTSMAKSMMMVLSYGLTSSYMISGITSLRDVLVPVIMSGLLGGLRMLL